jgi:serine/threonine-protein kinase
LIPAVRQFGKFRLVELLASGGMAEVWRAEMPGAAGFVKEIALKLVRGEHRADDAFTRMFIQEARLASRLDHANIVHVFDLGEVEGHYYIAMELVRGRTLREVADRCRELGVRFGVLRAVHVCAEIARALAYAHRLEVDGRPAGLVHRDVSPQNVLISLEGEVKLADFGIARAAGSEELTRAGTIKGKLAYMAPEQARGEPVDARADVFALGVVLWELCAGRRLFAREGEAATLAAVLDAAPISRPSAWNEAVPPELDEAVLAALNRDRERRTPSAEELAATLSPIRLRLAAASPEEIDFRALLRRLWPDGGAPSQRRREPTAVMDSPPVPLAAEPLGDPAGEPARRPVPSHEESRTRTLVRPRTPFSTREQSRRSLALVAVVACAIALAVVVLRWAEGDARRGGATTPARREARRAAAEAERARDAPPSAAPAAAPTSGSGDPEPSSAQPGPSAVQPAVPGTQPAPATAEPAQPAQPSKRATPAQSEGRTAADSGASRAARGRATLVVDVVPWATIYVDGERVGDTPLTFQVSAGAHEVRAVHPRLGSARARLELSPGERRRWAPSLSR